MNDIDAVFFYEPVNENMFEQNCRIDLSFSVGKERFILCRTSFTTHKNRGNPFHDDPAIHFFTKVSHIFEIQERGFS
jgi:hypothetical protein